MHRFFELQHLDINQEVLLQTNNIHKIVNVLKLRLNTNIAIFNGTGVEFHGEIIRLQHNKVAVKILHKITKSLSSPLSINLVHAIAKNNNMDWVIQKSVELGVSTITPIITQRTIVKPKDHVNKLLHWQTIATAACCQCGLNIIPKIKPIATYDTFVTSTDINDNYKLILDPGTSKVLSDSNDSNITKSKNFKISQQLKHILENCDYPKSITAVIGPEGGFTQSELSLASRYGFKNLCLGPRILRTETAPIVILSILQEKFGDL